MLPTDLSWSVNVLPRLILKPFTCFQIQSYNLQIDEHTTITHYLCAYVHTYNTRVLLTVSEGSNHHLRFFFICFSMFSFSSIYLIAIRELTNKTHQLRCVVFGGGGGSSKPAATAYEEALDALSSLITIRSRPHKSNSGDRFDLLFDYIKVFVYFHFFHGNCKVLV